MGRWRAHNGGVGLHRQDRGDDVQALGPQHLLVVGAGLKGTQWARAFAIHPRCAVVAVADTDEDNRALFAERFGLGAESAHADYEEMLRTQRLDIVAPILPVEPNPAVVRTPPARSLTPPGLSPR